MRELLPVGVRLRERLKPSPLSRKNFR
jgi:hypothetical protein